MLHFNYLNKISNISLAQLAAAINVVDGLHATVYFTRGCEDLHSLVITEPLMDHYDAGKLFTALEREGRIKTIYIRCGDDTIDFIYNGETCTAVFSNTATKLATDETMRKEAAMLPIGPITKTLVDELTENVILKDGLYFVTNPPTYVSDPK